MANLRMLCERYIQIDDEVKDLSKKLDEETKYLEKKKLTADYLRAYMELEDLKSGIRRHLIFELVEGIGNNG